MTAGLTWSRFSEANVRIGDSSILTENQALGRSSRRALPSHPGLDWRPATDSGVPELERLPMALNITEVPGLRGAGVTVLKLSGQVTLGRESQQLRQRIKSLLAEGKNQILVDLADVTHVDSAGLGTLVSSLTSVQGAGGRMKLANPPRSFRTCSASPSSLPCSKFLRTWTPAWRRLSDRAPRGCR